MTACLDTLIAEQATGDGLTDEERSRQTAETADNYLLSSELSGLIARAQAEWLPTDYTSELDPRAVLSVV